MSEQPEINKSKSNETNPAKPGFAEAETKKAVKGANTPRQRAAKRKKSRLGIPKEAYGIIGAILTTIIASIVAPLTIQAINRTPTPTLPPPTATVMMTHTLTASPTATLASTETPTPTQTSLPTPTSMPTATATPAPGVDWQKDCLCQWNWAAYPAEAQVDARGCLSLPDEWGMTFSAGKLSLYPDLGDRRGVFGVYTSLPQNAVVTLTFKVQLNTNVDFWIGFFDPISKPDQNGIYFSRVNGGFYRVIEVKHGVTSNKTTDLALGSTAPYTLVLTVDGNRMSLSGWDAVRNPIVIVGTFQVPLQRNLFIGYRANNANFISLDAFVSDLTISTP